MKPVHEMTVAEALEVANRRELNRRAGRPLDAPPPIHGADPLTTFQPLTDIKTVNQDEADEKEVAARGVQQARALGFVVANYSQPRSTKQTPGVQDKELFHPGRGIFLKWEVKTPRGKPSPDQVQYAEWCRACNVPYLCGTDRDLFAWLLVRYPLVRDEQGHLVWASNDPPRPAFGCIDQEGG